MTKAERELVEALADLQDFFAAPPETWTRHPMGTPLEGPLSVYGPVTKDNANSALYLLRGHFEIKLRAVREAWAQLPEDARRQIAAEVVLIQSERLIAALKREFGKQNGAILSDI